MQGRVTECRNPRAILLDVKPVRSELVYMLVRLDKKYTMESRGKWEDFYARGLLEHCSSTSAESADALRG